MEITSLFLLYIPSIQKTATVMILLLTYSPQRSSTTSKQEQSTEANDSRAMQMTHKSSFNPNNLDDGYA